jgi:hypothetical protein
LAPPGDLHAEFTAGVARQGRAAEAQRASLAPPSLLFKDIY